MRVNAGGGLGTGAGDEAEVGVVSRGMGFCDILGN